RPLRVRRSGSRDRARRRPDRRDARCSADRARRAERSHRRGAGAGGASRRNRLGSARLVWRNRRVRDDDPAQAMKATRGHLPWSNIEARLRGMREIWIATTSPNGRPDAVPVWFWWDGEVAYFTCKAGTVKPRNIAHEPHVVLHNGDGTDPIIVKGRADRVTD